MVNDLSTLFNITRIGKVSSVDVDNRTARVTFADKNNLVSGNLIVVQNQPLITIEKWVTEAGEESKWDYEAKYATVDRELGLDETYVKETPDIITNSKTITYEKKLTVDGGEPIQTNEGQTADTCPLQGVLEKKLHKQTVTVYPWLPYIGQMVLCIYLPNGESDGFIVGGI